MRKIFATVFLIFSLVFLALGFFALNLQSVLLNQDRVKNIVHESNAAQIASVYIEEKVIADNQLDLSSGDTLEKLNSVFGPDQIGGFLDDTVDRIFLAIRQPDPQNLKFTVQFPETANAVSALSFSRIVNLNGNNYIYMLSHFGLITLSLFLAGTIFMMLMAVSAGFEKGRFLKWLVGLFIPLGMVLVAAVGTLNFIWQKDTSVLADRIHFVADNTLKNGLAKVLDIIIQSQFWPYIIEISIIVILIILILFASRFYQKPSAEIKIEAAPAKKSKNKV